MQATKPIGRILSVCGAVVDVRFATALPEINTALLVEWDRLERLLLEVHAHLDPNTVRAVALQATGGLKRGTSVQATGEPISVPVGDAVLGRLLDVTGAADRAHAGGK